MTATANDDVSAPAEPKPARRRSFDYERSPLDVLHALTAVATLGIVVLLEFLLPTTLAAIEVDLVSAFERLPRWLDISVIVAAQLAAFIAQIALLVFLLRRPRRRLFAMSAAAVVVTVALFSLLDRWLDREAPEALNATLPGPQFAGEAWPATLWLGCVAAVLTIASTVMRRRWQVTAWTLFGLLVVLRLVTGTTLTIDVGAAIALGITIGAVTLLAAGRPDVHPTTDDVAAALRALQVDAPVVRAASVDARGSTPYFVDAANGRRVFAKVLTPRERYADIMFRLYRRVRYRGLGDERPFSTLRRAVEHEAMLSLMARDLGSGRRAWSGSLVSVSSTRSCSAPSPSTASRSTASPRSA